MSTRRLTVAEFEGGELAEEELGSERVSYDEALTISGRDQKDFKLGDDEGWTDKDGGCGGEEGVGVSVHVSVSASRWDLILLILMLPKVFGVFSADTVAQRWHMV